MESMCRSSGIARPDAGGRAANARSDVGVGRGAIAHPDARVGGPWVLALALALASVSTVSAQDEEEMERGRLHFQAGASYYEAGDYEDALREFTRAYELSRRPELLFNLHLCHQQLDQLDLAVQRLAEYLDQVDEVPNRQNLERRLDNLRTRRGDAGTEEPVEPPPPPRRGPNVPMIASFAVGGVGAVLAGVFGGLALAERGSLSDQGCGVDLACDAGTLRTRAIVADIGLGVAVVGVGLGVVFWLLGRRGEDQASARLRLQPTAGPNGGGAVLLGRF